MFKSKVLCFTVFVLGFITCYSQENKVYFSSTGDTVLFFNGGMVVGSDFDLTDWRMIVARFDRVNNRLDTLSLFFNRTALQDSPYKQLSIDTLNKYNLVYDGEELSDDEYETKIIDKEVKKLATKKDGSNLYQANLKIQFNQQSSVIGHTKISVLFLASKETDVDYENLITTYVKKKRGVNKYFVSAQVKSLACSPNDLTDCFFIERIFFYMF